MQKSTAQKMINPFAGIHDKIYRSYRIDQTLKDAKPTDVVLAKQENKKSFMFMRFDGVPQTELSSRLMEVPMEHRNFHSVLGRGDTKSDFYADIDLPKKHGNGEKVLIDLVKAANDKFLTVGFKDPQVLVLSNPGAVDKVSFHLHMRFPQAAFDCYSGPKSLAQHLNTMIGMDAIDNLPYRPSAMLRMAGCGKVGESSEQVLVPYTAADDELNRLMKGVNGMRMADIMDLSLGQRCTDGAALQTISFDQTATKSKNKEYDQNGNVIPTYLKESSKWTRFIQVKKKIQSLPIEAAESYDTWVRVGLALHNFGSEDAVFDEWVKFSFRCPNKYNKKDLKKKWDQFERNPSKHCWRRGFNYLNSTIWKEVRNL